MSVRVGVVMTTFQGARWVGEQVASIQAQTRPVDEVLVYDDGSTDGTVDVVRAAGWEVTVNPVRLGTVRNVEQGLRSSTADLVLLCDQDDVWHPERVERIVGAGVTGLLFHDAAVIDARGERTGRRLWETVGLNPERAARMELDPLGVLLEGNRVTGATVAVTRALLEVALPLPARGWHDAWLALVAAAEGLGVQGLAEPMIDYRVHDTNAAGLPPTGLRGRLAQGPAARRQRAEILAMLGELMPRLSPDPRARVAEAHAHLSLRQALPSGRLSRALPVARHLLEGAYGAHGGDWRTAVVDLLEVRSN